MSNHNLDANQVLVDAYDKDRGFKVDAGVLPTTPLVQNITILEAGEKIVYTTPADVKKVIIKVRNGMAKLQVFFGLNASDYYTLEKGCSLEFDAINMSNTQISFISDKPAQIVELLFWI